MVPDLRSPRNLAHPLRNNPAATLSPVNHGLTHIRQCEVGNTQRNTRLSSSTCAGTFAVSVGLYRIYRATAGTNNDPGMFLAPIQEKGSKSVFMFLTKDLDDDFFPQGCRSTLRRLQEKGDYGNERASKREPKTIRKRDTHGEKVIESTRENARERA